MSHGAGRVRDRGMTALEAAIENGHGAAIQPLFTRRR
jgi:hypothetical protein